MTFADGLFVGAREKPSQKLGVAPKGHNSQFFASFFFFAKGISPSADGGYFALCGERPRLRLWKPPPFEKGGRKLSRLGSVVCVCLEVTLGLAVCVRSAVTLLGSPFRQVIESARRRAF